MPIFRRGGSGGGGGSRPPGKKRPMGGGGLSGGKPFGAKKKAGKKKFTAKRAKKKVIKKKAPAPSIESTGMEALYLRDLMDAEAEVVIVLNNGDQLRGFVRYYDKDVFSLGPVDGSPKIFLRKESIRYLYEAED